MEKEEGNRGGGVLSLAIYGMLRLTPPLVLTLIQSLASSRLRHLQSSLLASPFLVFKFLRVGVCCDGAVGK